MIALRYTPYTLNLHNVRCQLYLNKAGRNLPNFSLNENRRKFPASQNHRLCTQAILTSIQKELSKDSSSGCLGQARAKLSSSPLSLSSAGSKALIYCIKCLFFLKPLYISLDILSSFSHTSFFLCKISQIRHLYLESRSNCQPVSFLQKSILKICASRSFLVTKIRKNSGNAKATSWYQSGSCK